MKMKLSSVAALCLSLLLVHTHFSQAKRGGFGKSFGFKKTPTSNRGSTHTNTGRKPNPGGSSPGGYPKQPGQPGQGGYPQQPGYPGGYPNQRGYPQQPGRPGYPNQYPAGGYPAGGYPAGGYPAGGYPARGSPYGGGYSHGGGYGSYGGGYGGHGSYGGYPGGYMNRNPNNQILSPHYGGSYGYGGYGAGVGSPFAYRVQEMGMGPSMKSKGFGRTAVMAAAGGAMAGMALGYGLGRFPRPHFNFHSPQEEYYYNHYMYRKYGTKSTDTDDYSRDYKFTPPPVSYDSHMDTCMKNTNLLPAANQQQKNKPAAAVPATTTTTTATTSAPDRGTTSSNTSDSNSTVADNSWNVAPSTPLPPNQPDTNSPPLASQEISNDDDDDTVSIMEIGYPALIEQLKARRCVELYMVYSARYLERQTETEPTAGVQGLGMGFRELLVVLTGTVLILLNSNILMLLH